MKKLICLMLVLCCLLGFTACGEPYDIDANIPVLQGAGFEVFENFKTPDELVDMNEDIKVKFQEYDVNFELNVTEYCSMVVPGAATEEEQKSCNFVRFRSNSEAMSVYAAMMTVDSELHESLGDYKVARFKNVIVLTNEPNAEKVVGGRFM